MSQADIFQDIEVIENADVVGGSVFIKKLYFPFVVCLNQECDLEQDFALRNGSDKKISILHYAVAPAFIFESFLTQQHWGEIAGMHSGAPLRRKETIAAKIMANEIPRYHYLRFAEQHLPELVIDFKQFFTVNADYLASSIPKRLCSLEDLYREQISHRFSFFISRIGLPEL